MPYKEKVLIVGNTAWYIANFRLRLSRILLKDGYDVTAMAPYDDYVLSIQDAGVNFAPIGIDSNGKNPFHDIVFFLKLFYFLRKENPDIYLGYTIKPNVYGGIACQLLNIPAIFNISGLGSVFITNTILTRLVRWMYRISMRKADKIFFQNFEDMEIFLKYKLVPPERVERLPGSGVDTIRFDPSLFHLYADRVNDKKYSTSLSQPFRFLLSSRLLWDKGVGVYVEAARMLISENRNVEFQIMGFINENNSAAIKRDQINAWVKEGVINYLGSAADVRPFIFQSDCFVLPSYYREGVPRSLLEAASMEKVIITTDVAGCRETVEDRITGLLCAPRDAKNLAEKMRKIMDASELERREMGKLARLKMIREFDETIVIDRYRSVVRELLQKRPR